eukprot:scaffold21955_cov23-Phaeocystis_antarctica.AAC.2
MRAARARASGRRRRVRWSLARGSGASSCVRRASRGVSGGLPLRLHLHPYRLLQPPLGLLLPPP